MQIYSARAVYTFDEHDTNATGVAVDGARIVAVGDVRALRRDMPDADEVDFGHRFIIPGFTDAHHHLSMAVLHGGAVDCSPNAVNNLDGLVRALQQRARTLPEGVWVIGTGCVPWKMGRRAPTRDELDQATRSHPVLVVDYSFHEGTVNSRALELLAIDASTPEPEGGEIVRDRRGRPTGRLLEMPLARAEATARKSLIARESEAWLERLPAYEDRLFAAGITRVCDPCVSPELEALYVRARKERRLRMPVVILPVGMNGYLYPPWDRLEGAPTGEGPEELRIGPLKIISDGAERCALCLTMSQSLALGARLFGRVLATRKLDPLRGMMRGKARLDEDGRIRSGILFLSKERAQRLARAAVVRGFSLAVHAIGNEGIERTLEMLQSVRGQHPSNPPPRIEHFMLTTPDLVRRAADAGITAVCQPQFLEFFEDDAVPRVPGLDALPFRSMLESGLRIAGSSDAPVTGFDPLVAIEIATTRTTPKGLVVDREQAIERKAAFAMYTREAARAAGALDVTGTIEPGKRADLVVLSGDPLGEARVRVVRTLLAGKTVYASETDSRAQGA